MSSDRSEEEFQNLGRRLELALEASQIGVWEHDLTTNMLIWDHRMHRIYGTRAQSDTVTGALWVQSIHPEDIERAQWEFDDAIRRQGEYFSEFRIIRPDGAVRHIRSRAHFFNEGDHVTFIGAEWDVTADVMLNRELQHQRAIAETRAVELEATSAQVEHVADHDYLTGLANRRFFDRRLNELAADTGVPKLALLHIGLDGFKQINDLAGHGIGDAVLKSAASLIVASVSPAAFVARVGGDEFAVLLHDFETHDDLQALANTLLERLTQTIRHNDEPLHLSASIGIASSPTRKGSDLLIESDVALFRAKRLGRGRSEFFSARMKAEIAREKRVAQQFSRGLNRGEIIPFYQIQVDAVTRGIIGVEALARWKHPRRGLLLPGDFLPIAASLGLMETLDTVILKAALDDRRNWARYGIALPRIAVNVSAARLSDPGLIDQLRGLAIEPGTVSFELLETIFLDEIEDGVLSNVLALKEMGIDVEIDDFGSGHASIIGLVKLKPSRLKIDRRLVLPITTSREQKRLVRSIVDIAKALSIEVVAEGVETLDHARILTRLGCNILQGYAVAYPASAADVLKHLIEVQEMQLAI